MDLQWNCAAEPSLGCLVDAGLLNPRELEATRALASDSALAECVACAQSMHLHIKVDDTECLPTEAFLRAGAQLDHGRPGFVKYRFPGGINAIFSHIHVSADDLRESPENRRPRPFLDHIGIDMREETDVVRHAFDCLPAIAARREWAHAAQGEEGKPVMCCHAQVGRKHWLYPAAAPGGRAIPLEFAFGPLRLASQGSGCDLRPADPRAAPAACCAKKAQPA